MAALRLVFDIVAFVYECVADVGFGRLLVRAAIGRGPVSR